jgi:hypothetical protein
MIGSQHPEGAAASEHTHRIPDSPSPAANDIRRPRVARLRVDLNLASESIITHPPPPLSPSLPGLPL